MKNVIPGMKLWIASEDGEGFFGEGKYRLLSYVQSKGSLSAAAKELNMSYRKAWGDIRKAEEGFGVRLIEKTRGGSGGGSATLTEEGVEIMNMYSEFKEAAFRFTKEFFAELLP